MNKCLFVFLVTIVFVSLTGNAYAFFQPIPKIHVINDDCLIENNTHIFVLSVLNEYSPLGKDATKTSVKIRTENALVTDIISLYNGDNPDFDTIQNNTILIDTDILSSGYSDSVFVFLQSKNNDGLLEINVTMFYGSSSISTNYSTLLHVCNAENITQQFTTITKKSSEFLGNWTYFWNILAGKAGWNSYISQSVLQASISITGMAFSLGQCADPNWIDVGLAIKDSFSRKVSVIGSSFGILTSATENLLSNLIISIASWTPETEKLFADIDELKQLFINESDGWNRAIIDYTLLAESNNRLIRKLNEISAAQEIYYYNMLHYHQLEGMLKILDDFLHSLRLSAELRNTEIRNHINFSSPSFDSHLSIVSIFDNTNISQLLVKLTNIGSEDITIGQGRQKCVTRPWGEVQCVEINSPTTTNLTIRQNNNIVYSNLNEWVSPAGVYGWVSCHYYMGSCFGYYDHTYFIPPNITTEFTLNVVPTIEVKDNMTATIKVVTLNTSDELNISLQRIYFLSTNKDIFLGININLSYCAVKERAAKIKVKESNLVNEYNKLLNKTIILNLSKGEIYISIFPNFYLLKKYEINFSQSANLSYDSFVLGNLNNDNKISRDDLDMLKSSFINQDKIYDINCDGIIDVLDMTIIGKNMYKKSDLDVDQINISIKMIKLSGTNTLDEGVMLTGNYNLTGFVLKDVANHTFTSPHFILNGTVFIHTGSGTNDNEHLYWNRASPVWNNDGDAAILLSPSGQIVSREECYQPECWY